MAELKYPLALVVRAVDKVTAPLNKINERLSKATRPLNVGFQRLNNRMVALSKAAGIPAVVKSFKSVHEATGKATEEAGSLLGKLTALAALSGGGLYGLVSGAESAGSRLEDLSTQAGLGVNAYAQLEFAAKRGGVENEAFAAGMKKFNKSLSEARRGVGPLAGLLAKVGPVFLKQLKTIKTNEQAFELLGRAMGQIRDPGKRAELAAAAFGEAGAGMASVLKDGIAPVDALREEFRKLAGDQNKFAAGAGELGDSFDNLGIATTALRNHLGGALFPAFQKLADVVTAFLVKNRDGLTKWAESAGAAIEKWVDGGGVEHLAATLTSLAETAGKLVDRLGGVENVATLVAVAMATKTFVAVGQLGVAMIGLGADAGKLAVRLGLLTGGDAFITWAGGWIKYLWMMRSALLTAVLTPLSSVIAATWAWTVALFANPLTWIVLAVVAAIALIAGGAYLLYKNWDKVSAWFKDTWEVIAWGASEAWAGFKTFIGEMWDGVVAKFKSAYEKIKPIIDAVQTVMEYTPLGFAMGLGSRAVDAFAASGSAPMIGAAAGTPIVGGGGDARVTVDFANAPPGMRVTPAPGNTAELDYSLGYTMRTP